MRAVRMVILGTIIVLASLAGTARVGAQTPTLTIYAAADLAFAFEQIVPLFEKTMGVKVTPVLGSTGNLAKQIEHGAPADVFFAANQSFVDDLITKDAVIAETRALYAQGRIVLATPKVVGPKLGDLRGLLESRIRKIAIANPEHAPYGKAAEQALRSLGLWETLKPKLVYGENIRHTLQFLQTGPSTRASSPSPWPTCPKSSGC